MKKNTILGLIALFLALTSGSIRAEEGSLVFTYATENAIVEPVRVSSDVVYITTDKPVKFKAFATAQPPVLTIELTDALLKTVQDTPVDGVFIKGLKTEQLEIGSANVARVVLDLTQEVIYDAAQKDTELSVVVSGKPGLKKIEIAPVVISTEAAPVPAVVSPVSAGKMMQKIGVTLGYARPLDSWANAVATGFGADLSYEGYKICDTLTLGANIFYASALPAKKSGFNYAGVRYSTLGLTPYLKAEKTVGARKTNLYGVLGLGVYRVGNTSGDELSGGVVMRSVDAAKASYFGLNLGGGLMYPLNDAMRIGGELKYHFVFASGINPNYLFPGVKFVYNFGGHSVQQPPAAAPVVPVISVPEVPAAAPDLDADGVADSLDKCPDTPASVPVDAAGCSAGSPAEVQAMDRLSMVAVPGSVTPGVAATVRDAAGDPACPWEQNDKLCMKLAMRFDYDKAELKGDFAAQLKEIAVFISANPLARIELQGYTDSSGNEDYNQKLSQARADAVLKYLMEAEAADAGRLAAKGMGQLQPVASNTDEEGRQSNRRVLAILTMGK